MTDQSRSTPSEPPQGGPGEKATAKFGRLSADGQIKVAAEALERNDVTALVVDSGQEAKRAVLSMLPVGAEVYNNTSRTLEAIALADDTERSGRYQPLRLRLHQMDREMQGRQMRQLAAAPDFVVASVHALTTGGSLLIASASGSQLGPLVSGAGHAILVIGGQKIVADLPAGSDASTSTASRSKPTRAAGLWRPERSEQRPHLQPSAWPRPDQRGTGQADARFLTHPRRRIAKPTMHAVTRDISATVSSGTCGPAADQRFPRCERVWARKSVKATSQDNSTRKEASSCPTTQ